MPPKLMLVRWLTDESIGVVPTSSIQKGEIPNVGNVARVKWGSKFYEAEVLQVSSKLLQLAKLNLGPIL